MENMGFDIGAMLAPPDILQCKRVLCIQPHPDDNEIGMGGIIAKLASLGCEIHYLTVTNGDMGNRDVTATPEETAAQRVRRPLPPANTWEPLTSISWTTATEP